MTSSAFVRTIDVNDLLPLLDDRSEMGLVDVREPDEFASWHIPGAVNIPLGQLADRLSDVPRTPRLVTICALGSRATEGAAVAISVLLQIKGVFARQEDRDHKANFQVRL